jgi:hypothetical protein
MIAAFFKGLELSVLGGKVCLNNSIHTEDGRKMGDSRMLVKWNITFGLDCDIRGSA